MVEISNVWFSKVYSKLDENMAVRIKIIICEFVSTISLLTALIPVTTVNLNFHHKELKFY